MTDQNKGGNSSMIFLFIAMIILLVAVVFALQNNGEVPIKFIGWKFESSLALILAVVLIFGILVGLFTAIGNIWRRSRIISRQKKEIKRLEQQVAGLQNDRTASQAIEEKTQAEQGGLADFDDV